MGKSFILKNCKPRQGDIEAVRKLKQHEESSALSRHVITELPPPMTSKLEELREYAFRHGHTDAYSLNRRELEKILYY